VNSQFGKAIKTASANDSHPEHPDEDDDGEEDMLLVVWSADDE
jgi:hypothetical protein